MTLIIKFIYVQENRRNNVEDKKRGATLTFKR